MVKVLLNLCHVQLKFIVQNKNLKTKVANEKQELQTKNKSGILNAITCLIGGAFEKDFIG